MVIIIIIIIMKGKGKGYPRTCHEGEGSRCIQLYCFFNLGFRWRWMVNATPQPL
jgi:hypothetical protein